MNIHLSKYPIFVKLGLFPEERLAGQEILMSLEVELDSCRSTSNNEDLSNFVDYGEIISCLDTLLKGKEIKLIETIVLETGEVLLEKFSKIKKISVCVEKPILPNNLNKSGSVSISHKFKRR